MLLCAYAHYNIPCIKKSIGEKSFPGDEKEEDAVYLLGQTMLLSLQGCR